MLESLLLFKNRCFFIASFNAWINTAKVGITYSRIPYTRVLGLCFIETENQCWDLVTKIIHFKAEMNFITRLTSLILFYKRYIEQGH